MHQNIHTRIPEHLVVLYYLIIKLLHSKNYSGQRLIYLKNYVQRITNV